MKKFLFCLVSMTLLASALAFPAFGAMSDAEFLKLCESGSAREVQAALENGDNAVIFTAESIEKQKIFVVCGLALLV